MIAIMNVDAEFIETIAASGLYLILPGLTRAVRSGAFRLVLALVQPPPEHEHLAASEGTIRREKVLNNSAHIARHRAYHGQGRFPGPMG